ncbi:MAG: selenocysteine-specific translation elongation factor [Candidatus Dormibacteraceae bacterium]
MSHVIGTAGHVDHGKSTLIHALTGIDPDRLEEEKRRGMTIDLGFAYLTLPSGRLVGFVDVPGHARFIRNMLAGVHGVDAVLLVVAADEGVMPQTVEHLDIVQLLEIDRGVVALTKVDLVEEDWLRLVTADLAERLAGTSLAGAEILPVSAATGAGIEDLRACLDRLLDRTSPRLDHGRPRLPVDRVFTVGGFGTVVTGTLVDGALRVGEQLEALPAGRRVRVRGLQQHNRRVEVAEPGSRVAANLIGIDREGLRRGDVLALPGSLAATRRIDARVRVLADSPRALRHGAQLRLHTGTAEVSARAIVLGGDTIEAGAAGWLQLYLAEPVAVDAGDRFVLRLPSPSTTLAGGAFVDVAPRRHLRRDPEVVGSLERRLHGAGLAEELRKFPRGATAAALARASRFDPAALASLPARRAGDLYFSTEAWGRLADLAGSELAGYHHEHPLRAGMPREELKSRLGLEAPAFGAILRALVEDGTIREAAGAVALPDHQVELEIAEGPAERLLDVLGRDPHSPPSISDAISEAGAGRELFRALVGSGQVVRLSEDVAFTRAAYESAVRAVREVVAAEGAVTVAGLRDRLHSTRRPMLALLEHLDSERVTRRVGDGRVIR